MQLIFGKNPPKKRNRKKLVFLLITSEIIGILVLVWFLRIPLYEKFLTQPSTAYDSNKMVSNKQYLVSQNDQIIGKATPGSKIKFYLSPVKQITSIQTDSQGVWIYQIPKDLPVGKYQLYVAEFDQPLKTALIKNYRFRVTPRGFFEKAIQKIFSSKFINKAFAQDEIFPELLPQDEPIDELNTEPVVDPQFEKLDPVPANNCPEEGCPATELDILLKEPIECDPNTVGYIIKINPDTSEAESIEDNSGLCTDSELGDSSITPIFLRAATYPGDKATRKETAYCPSEEMLDNNKKPGACRLFNSAVDIFDLYFYDEQKEAFIQKYSPRFIGKEVFLDYLVNFEKNKQDLLDEGKIIKKDKYGEEVYMIGDENEFRRRTDFIVDRARYAELNPAIFLGYWMAESDLSTSWAADLGCDPYTKRANFEREVTCALGLDRNGQLPFPGEKYGGSFGPRCARSKNADSEECEATPRLNYDDKPIEEFETLFIPHADFSKASLPTASGDCTHSYNETLRVIINIDECGQSSQKYRYYGR